VQHLLSQLMLKGGAGSHGCLHGVKGPAAVWAAQQDDTHRRKQAEQLGGAAVCKQQGAAGAYAG